MDAQRLSDLGDQFFAAFRLDEALDAYSRALALVPRHAGARAGLDAILERARTDRPNPRLIELMLAAYADPGANWDAVGWGAAHQLVVGWPNPPDPERLARDELLRAFLTKSLNRNPALERHLLALRTAVARSLVSGSATWELETLAGALAEQAWQNEYLWPDDPSVTGLAAAMFRPPNDARPAQLEEQRLAASIPSLAPIADGVSKAVAAMYEANPYPRWTHLPRRPPVDVRAALGRDFPHAGPVSPPDGPHLEVLMPGAGTGQHPLSVAASYVGARVTALDLSRASLAYGKRMAADLGIDNIAFLHGDILDLPTLGRRFDHAECVGVLHHMSDPKAGLLAISAVLRWGAFLRLGLYGEAARRTVVKARREIALAGLSADLNGLREFRRRVLAGEWRALASLVESEDFWSASLLRDLCFHVQEHRFTVARVRALLEGTGLRFLGFEFNAGSVQRSVDAPAIALYRIRFPAERTLSDLSRWEQLERERPDLFPGYAFVCQ